MDTNTADFAATAVALYFAHHAGDYWVQTDHQAAHKGAAGRVGRVACAAHVATYTLTQGVALAAVIFFVGADVSALGGFVALLVSAVTHYLADRREFGVMLRLARLLPGKARFVSLGVPRPGRDDNPSLGTGSWALDQSWHYVLGCFVPAILAVVL